MFLAAHTTRLRVLTSVMVLPHRPPVLAAKALATIDILSSGRLIVGVGAGWMREEFEALGAPPFEKRGAVAAEYIRLFRELWTVKFPSFSGAYASVSGARFEPKPVQKPHPPVWVGGESPAALRRAGRLGDAWYPIGSNPTYPMDSIARLKSGIDSVSRHARESGRSDQVGTAYSAGWYEDRRAVAAADGSRRFLTGEPGQVAEDLHALEDLGVRHVVLGLQAPSPAEIMKRMERFASVVSPLLTA
jgi:probable F420-dependent oxidoreductase